MKTYNIIFNGYIRDEKKESLPEYSGVYIVYRCMFNPQERTVTLIEILYIGQAENINHRICNHDKRDEFFNELTEDETICYSYAKVDKKNLDIIENALIFAQKPRLNDKLVDNYNYDSAEFKIEGRCSLLKHTNYTIN